MKKFVPFFLFLLSLLASAFQVKSAELSHYIFPAFTKGRVLMKSGQEYSVLLNYNSVTAEMVFQNEGKKMAIGIDAIKDIDTIYIEKRKFVTVDSKFVELISKTKVELFIEHKCRIIEPGKNAGYGGTSQTDAITSYSTLMTDGRVYELELPDGYKTRPYNYYWIRKNGSIQKFGSLHQLKKLYKEKKALYKAYMDLHDVKIEDETGIKDLVNYLETN